APVLLNSCGLPTSFPPGVMMRSLRRCRFILPRLGVPRLGLLCVRFLPGRSASSSLMPLCYLHSIVRFDCFVCPPFLCASMWWTWHLSAGTVQSGHGQTRFSAIAIIRCFGDAKRASYKLTGPAVG